MILSLSKSSLESIRGIHSLRDCAGFIFKRARMRGAARGAKFGAATVAVPFQLSEPRLLSLGRGNNNVASNETVMEKLGGTDACAARVQQGDRTAWLPRVCRSRRKSSIGRPAIGRRHQRNYFFHFSFAVGSLRRFLQHFCLELSSLLRRNKIDRVSLFLLSLLFFSFIADSMLIFRSSTESCPPLFIRVF